MSRETEKILKELQRFLDSHADEIKSEDDANALAEQFLVEYDQKCAAQKDEAPETADEYLDLAEQATSKKKHMEYLRKALELEPDNLDARLQMITCTTEHHLDEQRLALQELLALAEKILSGEVPPFCPHGRPCVLKLTRKELEKQFGRIV